MNDQVESVTEQLAEDLRQGQFAPGTWLKQVDLQQRYGVGRTTIRKALETLTVRRLVRHELNKGYSVYPCDNEQVRHVLEVRAALESGFAAKMVELATVAQTSRLQALADDFQDLARQERLATAYQVNLEFHRMMLGLAGNPLLLSQAEELRLRMSAAPVSQWADMVRLMQSAEEHHRMIAALRARNADMLRRLIAQHILKPDV
jgi:DNA-binding GntR family transcriptional regulator